MSKFNEVGQFDWIGVDWGTTNCRAYAMTRSGRVVAEAASDKGMSRLGAEAFESQLLDLVAPWIKQRTSIEIVICGMAGAKQGWKETPYVSAPCYPPTDRLVAIAASNPQLNVSIIPGVKQDDPADVMRGEETQIRGYLDHFPEFEGVICLPGTHTKWVRVVGGKIVEFQTFMTGEVFEALSRHSILRHEFSSEWDDDLFLSRFRRASKDPGFLFRELFRFRSRSLLCGSTSVVLFPELSGALIGCELASAQQYWRDGAVVLIGEGQIAKCYSAALAELDIPTRTEDGPAITCAGLMSARESQLSSQC